MKCYKLTTQDGKTMPGSGYETQWGEGVRHVPFRQGTPELCTGTVIHAGVGPLSTVFLNPIHADIDDPILWECDGEGEPCCDGLKFGFPVALTTLRRREVPNLQLAARVRCAIILAQRLPGQSKAWRAWADRWLDGRDRTVEDAETAKVAAAARAEAAEAAWAWAWAAKAALAEAAADAAAEAWAWAAKAAAARAAKAAAARAARAAAWEAKGQASMSWGLSLEALLAECVREEALR